MADRVVMVESAARIRRRPSHRRKLVLVLSAMRHRAEALAAAGMAVDHVRAGGVVEALSEHIRRHRPDRLVVMDASEYRGRVLLERLPARLGLPVEILPNTQMLVGRHDPFPDIEPGRRVVMERFYRRMRTHFGLLMEPGGTPVGGAWNHDRENRRPYPRSGLVPPPVPRFPPDELTARVMAEVSRMPGIGSVDGFDLPVTAAEAAQALEDFVERRLPSFGPYEDAMSAEQPVLYHSMLSPALNLGLLDPLDLCRAAESAYRSGAAPIQSAEGLVRQVAGWREYVFWTYRRLMPGMESMNAWGHRRPLPDWFWTGDTDLRCLATVIRRVLSTGYSHHIERLMVLCNFALLSGIDPFQVNEWFLSCYVDAYEWVVTPNVVGMGLNADSGITATKPYIASGRYVERMSDYCRGCRYDPGGRSGTEACPISVLYWDFLLRHEAVLRGNPRMGPAVLALRHLDDAERRLVAASAGEVLSRLVGAGEAADPQPPPR
jgi:deoxyribodipyrimidine photolyase-related protein